MVGVVMLLMEYKLFHACLFLAATRTNAHISVSGFFTEASHVSCVADTHTTSPPTLTSSYQNCSSNSSSQSLSSMDQFVTKNDVLKAEPERYFGY